MFGVPGEAILGIGAVIGMVVFTIAHVLGTVLEEHRRLDRLKRRVAVLQAEYARRRAQMQARAFDGGVDVLEDPPDAAGQTGASPPDTKAA